MPRAESTSGFRVEGPLQRMRTASKGFTGIAHRRLCEWSQTLVDLIKIFAEMGASKWMDRLGALSPERRGAVTRARSTLMRLMCGQLCMRVARGHAKRARIGGAGARGGRCKVRGTSECSSGSQYWGRRRGCVRGRAAAGARGPAGAQRDTGGNVWGGDAGETKRSRTTCRR